MYVKKHWRNLSGEGEKILRIISEERREVSWMKKELTDMIEGVKSLALLAKVREKMNQQMMDTLECCKQHDGPVTAKDIQKLR